MRTGELNEFAKQLLGMLHDIRREFTKAQKNELTRGIISLPQLTILEHLYKNNTRIMSDIAKLLSVSMSAATGLVERMIKNRYLIRSHDLQDRRIVHITITTRGKKIAKSFLQMHFKMIKRMFGNVSKKDRIAYLNIVSKIHKSIKNTKAKE